VITDAATLLQNSPERSDAHRIAVDVPPGEVWLQADEGQLRQIVWNLATNGLRAMSDGGCLTLGVRGNSTRGHDPSAPRRKAPGAEAPGGEVVIEVCDEGTGIAPEELDGIFQPFRSRFARGTGLGLSIVQRIVADYGGEIQVTSDHGAGTTVLVRMPVAAALSEKVS
jgi:signal transduction histidine kinase